MIYIGAWHKTGTNIIKRIFNKYKEEIPEFNYHYQKKLQCNFHHYRLENSKAILCIRNPYEIIISGMRYHQITKERNYLKPNDRYNGLSYKDHISSLETDEEKILFEMRETSYLTITSMYDFLRDHSQYEIYSKTNKNHNLNDDIVFIKLEQFWTEQGREEVAATITSHVPSMDKDILTKCIEKHGSKKLNKTHSGFNYTYQDYFTDSLYKEFNSLFPPDVFDILGYPRK